MKVKHLLKDFEGVYPNMRVALDIDGKRELVEFEGVSIIEGVVVISVSRWA